MAVKFKIFPTLDDHDAFALGMDGLGLPGIFMIPDLSNAGGTMIDPLKNQDSMTYYYQTIYQAITAVVPYRTGNAGIPNAGTPYC